MIHFKTKSGKWTANYPVIKTYYRLQDYLALSDEVQNKIKLLSIISGAPEDEIRELDIDEFERVWQGAKEGPLNGSIAIPLIQKLEVDGVRYGFINLGKLSIGELADMETLKAHPQANRQLHKMMAILYRPILEETEEGYQVEEYSVESFAKRAEIFEEKMFVVHVLSAIDFFFHTTQRCLNSMMDSLVKTMIQIVMNLSEEEKIALTSKLQETGIDLSTFLQETTSSSLTTAQNLESSESLIF